MKSQSTTKEQLETDKANICASLKILTTAKVLDYNGHVSIRQSGGGFLINSGSSKRQAMTTDQITSVNDDGEVVTGDRPPNEVFLHTAIYKSRPDIQAVVHGHPRW
ncbi:MAG: class II aldolase/adducin family protein, partial [Gammaproteobacteria bacterium]|nr:class II aldolase/adducin family protein [Gammaproteobacteria bacterium]